MSGLVTLELPAKDKKELARLQITKGKIKVRLVRAELESVDTEILLTSLANENVFTPGS